MNQFIYGILLLLLPAMGLAQSNWEFNILGGTSTYMGDLVKTGGANLNECHPAFGVSGTYYINPSWALRTGLHYGKISGDDFTYEERAARGIYFENKIAELSVVSQWEPFGPRKIRERERNHNILSPYYFAGFAVLYSSRATNYSKISSPGLVKKSIEDQEKNDTGINLAIPFGTGIKFHLSSKTVFGFEVGMRASFTDYLDGVSMAGNPDKNDWYIFGGVMLGFRFGKKEKE